MKTNHSNHIIVALLILLYTYTAVSKLLVFEEFRDQMYNQALPRALATVLIWSLPAIELLTAGLLLSERTKLPGLYLSAVLMTLFTAYIGLVLLNYFGRVPCSCGGVIQALGWKLHLVFNLFFLLLTILAIMITNRERRHADKVI
jgi:putative oxidoreductase